MSIGKKSVYLSVFVLVILFLFGSSIFHWVTSETIEVKVVNIEREVKGDNNSKYIVTTENEVFENTDAWCWLKFDSSEIQRTMQPSGIYLIKVSGFRWEFASWYRNIVDVRGVIDDLVTDIDQSSMIIIKKIAFEENISDKSFREVIKAMFDDEITEDQYRKALKELNNR